MASEAAKLPAREAQTEYGRPISVRGWRDYALTALFIILCWVRLTHHQIWRDETNVWAMALASHSLGDLASKLRYEGHPLVWYALLWFVSQFTHSLVALKVVQGAVSAGIYIILGLFSPFSRLERVLLFCSYYIFFEYTIISRTYGLCALFLLLYVCLRFYRPQWLVAGALLLVLMANSDVMGVLLGGVLACEYAYSRLQAGIPWRRLIPAFTVFVLGFVACYLTVKRAPDASVKMYGHLLDHKGSLPMLIAAVVSNVSIPWLPVRFTWPRPFWNPTMASSNVYLLVCPLVLVAYWALFAKRRPLLFVVAGTLAASTLFSFLIYFGSVRNFGVVFLAFLFAIWAIRMRAARLPVIATALLAVAAVEGIAAGIADYTHPFSNAGAAAHWLVSHDLADEQLIGTPDTSVENVAEQLGKPAYMLDCNCSDTYMEFSTRRDNFTEDQTDPRIVQAARLFTHSQDILVLAAPLNNADLSYLQSNGVQVSELATFTGAETNNEDYYLYAMHGTATHPVNGGDANSSAAQIQRSPARDSPPRPRLK